MKTGRVIVIVLDGCGVGELPDAGDYGDKGANTLGNLLVRLGEPPLPHLQKLGLFELLPSLTRYARPRPISCYGKMAERSQGKDSTTGHWEMMGIITRKPFPTYPEGFPESILRPFEKQIGRKILGNVAASGTEIIQELGEEHLRTGYPIVYTSVDSVFQIAAHDRVYPVPKLYRVCETARKILRGKHAMGRVIARPFTGPPGKFRRTHARKDFTLPPPSPTVLDILHRKGARTVGIGKTGDLFSNRGLSRATHIQNNAEGIARTIQAMRSDTKAKLIFTNLVDTDMVYGHRNDCRGYYQCLREFDRALPVILSAMRKSDALFITSDHGCDPTTPGTDHTREYVPILAYGPALRRDVNLGTRKSLADVGQTVLEMLGASNGRDKRIAGTSFARQLTE